MISSIDSALVRLVAVMVALVAAAAAVERKEKLIKFKKDYYFIFKLATFSEFTLGPDIF
jgi:hypothetical protein